MNYYLVLPFTISPRVLGTTFIIPYIKYTQKTNAGINKMLSLSGNNMAHTMRAHVYIIAYVHVENISHSES